MTTTTLEKTDIVKLDGSGNGTITLRPDVGQNWAPLFVRVSTNNRNTPVPYCVVYHGSPGVAGQPSQFIDDTFLGNGDSSSMIAGTAIVFGQAVIFNFTGGTPGDVAIATVYGMQSDLPPNLSLTPQVPGTHFTGHPTTEIATTAKFVGLSSPVTVPAGGTVFLTADPHGAVPDDVRQYTSYYLKINATAHTPPATGFNGSQITMLWYSAQSIFGGTLVFEDSYEWWTDSIGGGTFGVTLGPVLIQDAQHGPYLVVQYTNNAPTDSVDINFVLEYTTRPVANPMVRQESGIEGVLLDISGGIVPAGGLILTPAALGYGMAGVLFVNPGAHTMEWFVSFAPDTSISNENFIQVVPAATGIGRQPPLIYPFPKKAACIIVHAGTPGDIFEARITTQFTKV